MRSNTGPHSSLEVRRPQNVRRECQLFWQGVVESFGVEWGRAEPQTSKDGKPPASTTEHGACVETGSSAPEPSSPLTASSAPPHAVNTEKTHTSSPLLLDTASCPSPAAPSSAATAGGGDGWRTSSSSPPFPSAAPVLRLWLMPPWSLVEHDPKLWMLLRKNLLANVALIALTLTYMGLSRRLAAAPSHSLLSSSPVSPVDGDTRGSSSSSSLYGLLVFWWLRLCLWGLKYMGQWPFYTVLQIIGLVWYSQLYRETWLVRKRWVLRGTRLREASPLSREAGAAARRPAASPPALPQLTEGVWRPWLAPIPLNREPRVSSGAATSARHPAWQQTRSLLDAAMHYNRHVANLLLRMLRHKGPTLPLQEWVLGDASAAAAAVARQSVASSSSSSAPQKKQTSPDVFEDIVRALESTSEVIFKAMATMSFALCASCVAWLPIVGTPLCLLLNAQLYAFYVFDYRYATQQQPGAAHPRGSALLYQLQHFEQCWVYYAGYGIGSAVLSLWLTHLAGVVVSVCAMSVLYSWQVVWSGFAVPQPSSRPLPLFSLWFYAVDMIQKQYAVLWRCVCILGLLYVPYQCVRYL